MDNVLDIGVDGFKTDGTDVNKQKKNHLKQKIKFI